MQQMTNTDKKSIKSEKIAIIIPAYCKSRNILEVLKSIPKFIWAIIIVNDVFEHLPNLDTALIQSHSLLENNGILAINLPMSDGYFYRISDLMDRMGFSKPMERLWQRHFPSPHLSYFNQHQLESLVERFGFKQIDFCRLASISIRGLFSRLNYDNNRSALYSGSVLFGLLIFWPCIKLFPSDISMQLFQKRENGFNL